MTNNPTFNQITKPHPSIKQPERSKQVTLTPQHPINKLQPPQATQNKKTTPKASQTADLNCLNFKLAVPPPKQGHTQNSCPTRSSQPPTLFIPEKQDSKPIEFKI